MPTVEEFVAPLLEGVHGDLLRLLMDMHDILGGGDCASFVRFVEAEAETEDRQSLIDQLRARAVECGVSLPPPIDWTQFYQ